MQFERRLLRVPAAYKVPYTMSPKGEPKLGTYGISGTDPIFERKFKRAPNWFGDEIQKSLFTVSSNFRALPACKISD